jgi:hypothetical protein
MSRHCNTPTFFLSCIADVPGVIRDGSFIYVFIIFTYFGHIVNKKRPRRKPGTLFTPTLLHGMVSPVCFAR